MKNTLLALSFLFSVNAFAGINTVTVDVPAGATAVNVTATDVTVDVCNGHGLMISEGKNPGVFSLAVISTLMACSSQDTKKMDLGDRLELSGEQSSLTFSTEYMQASGLEISFE